MFVQRKQDYRKERIDAIGSADGEVEDIVIYDTSTYDTSTPTLVKIIAAEGKKGWLKYTVEQLSTGEVTTNAGGNALFRPDEYLKFNCDYEAYVMETWRKAHNRKVNEVDLLSKILQGKGPIAIITADELVKYLEIVE